MGSEHPRQHAAGISAAQQPRTAAPTGHPGPEGVPPENFHRIYAEGSGRVPAPWAIGRPQRAIAELASRMRIEGPLLDIGCGTGDNAILLAHEGIEVVGVDLVPRAIEIARARAEDAARNRIAAGEGPFRAAPAFEAGSALDLPPTVRTRRYRTLLDCAVLHVFSDADRLRYRAAMDAVAAPDATFIALVFSELETRPGGPRRMRVDEICGTLGAGWSLERAVPARYEHVSHAGGARAWLAVLKRRGA